jgi:hypothetical protein
MTKFEADGKARMVWANVEKLGDVVKGIGGLDLPCGKEELDALVVLLTEAKALGDKLVIKLYDHVEGMK